MVRLALLATAAMAARLLMVRLTAADNVETAATALGLSDLANDFLACAGLRDYLGEEVSDQTVAQSLHEGANGAEVAAHWLLMLIGMEPERVAATGSDRRASWENEFSARAATGQVAALASHGARCQAIQPLQSAMVRAARALIDSGGSGVAAYLSLLERALSEEPAAAGILRQAIDR